MLKAIENLDVSKSFAKDNIPPKIINENKDIFSIVLTNGMRNFIFPVNLNLCGAAYLFY